MAYGYIVEASANGSNGWAKWVEPNSFNIRRDIQANLKRLGRYTGIVDGIWGPLTIKGIQTTAKKDGRYSGPVDGAVGGNTCMGVVKYANRWGPCANTFQTDAYVNQRNWECFSARLASIPLGIGKEG